MKLRPALSVPALAVTLVAFAACGGNDASRAEIDTLLARDLTLASSATAPAAQVALGDTATTSAAVEQAPAQLPVSAAPSRQPKAQTTTPIAPSPQRQAQTQRPRQAPTVSSEPAAQQPVPQPAPVVQPTTPPAEIPAPIPAPAPARKALGVGATLVGNTTQQICSVANRPGDRFVATLTSDVTSADGARLPAGTPILVELAQAPEGQFAFRAKAVQIDGELVPVQGSVRFEGATTERRIGGGNDKEKVIGGAVAGAIIGRVLGGSTKGAVIGAAGGAAAGTIAASRGGTVERCIPEGSSITVTLTSPLVFATGTP